MRKKESRSSLLCHSKEEEGREAAGSSRKRRLWRWRPKRCYRGQGFEGPGFYFADPAWGAWDPSSIPLCPHNPRRRRYANLIDLMVNRSLLKRKPGSDGHPSRTSAGQNMHSIRKMERELFVLHGPRGDTRNRCEIRQTIS
ncbi:hypothetical protein R1flu_019274 [Riccia fluitans]|uniref:Uncharacterized protein n=1 Tax=Riccia fluitans TaxID=41844 RepID=A0ABD1ZJR6_9MARC